MATLLEYKCPACGGAVAFDSALQKVKCPYCDTEYEMETLKALDADLQNEAPEAMDWDTTAQNDWQEGEARQLCTFVCSSCSGELISDANTAATLCPYCGNPVVLKERLAGGLRPDMVIPFRFSKEDAKAALARHLTGKPLLPKVFKSENQIDKIQGVYVPFWLFDADVDADFRFRTTKVRSWSDSRYYYTKTSHYSVLRSGSLGFAAVPVDGSSKMANDLMESIEPYDLSQAVDFQTAYLAGYLADKYDIAAETCAPRANDRIKASTQQTFTGTVQGYTTVNVEHGSVRLKNQSVKYALYPVWMLNTTYRGEKFTFAMNGQTGKMVGNLPLDKTAYWLWWAGITAAATAVFSLLGMLLA